jgi:predicted permease
MTVAMSILPIFLVIALGYIGARRGMFPEGFIAPANRLAFYLAIPALVFRAVASAPIAHAWQPAPAVIAICAQLAAWLLALALFKIIAGDEASSRTKASWVQCAIHGNQGMLGLAVVFYGLGEKGVQAAGLILTAIIIMQNLLSVISLNAWGAGGARQKSLIKALGFNPIILATFAGLAVSLSEWRVFAFLDRTLQILGAMGLPLALLIIGARLTGGRLGENRGLVMLVQVLKLMVMPALGLLLLTLLGVGGMAAAVTVILLSSPAATITVIMAGEMGGDSRLSSQAVSLGAALSAFTYTFWLWWFV